MLTETLDEVRADRLYERHGYVPFTRRTGLAFLEKKLS